MPRFLTVSLMIFALIAFARAPFAFAASPAAITSATVSSSGTAGAPPQTSVQGTTANGTQSATNQKNPAAYPPPSSSPSSYNTIMILVMNLFAWLLGVAAITLDNAVYYTVITMGNYVNNLTAVGIAWSILRDIGNIVLIFGFLAIGIATILDVNWYGNRTKMLPILLIAAIFLNFSLFISEAIIDAGNLFATEFYTQINGGNPPQPLNPLNPAAVHTEGISNKIMSQLGLQSIYGNSGQVNTAIFQAGNTWVIGFMGILLFMIAAFVMFSLAYILIARFVALIFLIIIAPIGFAGLAVPKLSSSASKWWSTLIDQTITAPILLLLLYVALRVITDQTFLTGFCLPSSGSGNPTCTPNWTGFASGNFNGFASMMLSFIVAMGLLLAVVVFSRKMSAFGASWATKAAGAATFGATAWGANRTIGRGAYYLRRRALQSETFNKVDAATGRVTSRVLGSAATATYDVRASKAFKNIPYGGIAAGEAAKGGFVGARKRSIEAHEQAAKDIEEAHKNANWETPEDRAAIEKATERKGEAEKTHLTRKGEKEKTQKAIDAFEAERKVAAQQVAAHKEELDRLEAEEKRREAFAPGVRATPEEQRKLDTARSNLATSKTTLETSEKNLAASKEDLEAVTKAVGDAAGDLKKASEALTAAEGAAGTRMKKSIEENKKAYAGGVVSPVGWVVNGPGSGAAAQKIRASLKEKGYKEKLEELVRAQVKEEDKMKEKEKVGGEEKPKEESKPEAGH